MLAGNWKSYADFVSKTDWMEPDYDSPSKDDLWEDWIERWMKDNEVYDIDKETEDILWDFFDKVVYRDYDDSSSNRVDWTLEEIKEYLLDWYIKNYDKVIEQLGHLIRDVQKNKYESDVLKQSRHVYTDQTGSCI
jgi:hypothetical protein